MHGKRLKAGLIASLAVVALAGCGAAPSPVARPTSGASSLGVRATRPMAPQAKQDDQDISKNPFVVWIKQTHPKEAAAVIDQYLSTDATSNADPSADGQRVLLRQQAIDTVAKEMVKNLMQGLPQGLVAKVAEPGHVRVSGYQKQFGFNIAIQFDFTIQMDKAGMIWLKVPPALVKASADSALVRMFGGNLNEKAYTEIIKEVDKQGPPNARKTPGLTYLKAGTFRLDPGFAFINMPS